MTGFHAHADPPRTLAERLEQLNNNLHSLSGRLKDAIASAVSTAVGEALRDAVRSLLGKPETPAPQRSASWPPEPETGLWNDTEESRWNEEAAFQPQERHSERKPPSARWGNALGMAVQTAIWWMRQQPRRRPVLTTTVVALAAGVTAFLAGPALAAGVGVLASAASLFLTANTATSAGEQLRSLATG